MKKASIITGSIGLGAGLMYLFDPDRGKRRRALIRDKAAHGLNKTGDAIGKTSRDIAHRARGVLSDAGSLFYHKELVDEVIVARVRSKLGRLVSHPHAITATSENGRVTLSGPVLAAEADRLINRVSAIAGVKGVENRLELHDESEHISALQGGEPRTGRSFAFSKTNWSPTARLIAGTAGGALAFYAVRRQPPLSTPIAAAGLSLLTRALTNIELPRLVGVGRKPGIEVQKVINIAAPVEQVFEFWRRHEDFPLFMSNVREVRKTGEGRYHWTVAGPAGVSVEWDAEITNLVPNKLLEWESLEGSALEQKGRVLFRALSEGETSIEIRMSYNPPAGVIGHLVAKLFGADPKSEMDADLMRVKTYIETGRLPHDAAKRAAASEAASR
jgi:uncharacterized membrane protein